MPPHRIIDAARLATLPSYGILGTASEVGFDGVVLLARMARLGMRWDLTTRGAAIEMLRTGDGESP